MTEIKKKSPNKQPNYRLRRAGAFIGMVIATGFGMSLVKSFEQGDQAGSNSNDEPDLARIYTVKQGDSEWQIFNKAKLSGDPRKFVDKLDKTIPDDASHPDHMLQPGDELFLPANSKVGIEQEVPPGTEVPSFIPTKGGVQGDYPPPLPPA